MPAKLCKTITWNNPVLRRLRNMDEGSFFEFLFRINYTSPEERYLPDGEMLALNSLGDWYEQNLCRVWPRAVWVRQFWKMFMPFLASSERVVQRSRVTVTGRGGTETDTGRGTVLLVSVSEGVRRTTSPCQISTFPPGKYNFLFTPSTTDTRTLHTASEPAVRAAVKTWLSYPNDSKIAWFVAATKSKDNAKVTLASSKS